MHTYSFPDAKNIVVCGDIHGHFNEVIFKMCVQYQMTDTLLIIAGDCGFGFEKPGYYDIIFNHLKSDGHPVSHWYYGHFHRSWTSEIEGVLFSMLDIMEFKEVR